MNKIILLLIPLSLLLNCDGGKATFATLEFVNGTDYSIEIEAYDNYPNRQLRKKIVLSDKESSWASVRQKFGEP